MISLVLRLNKHSYVFNQTNPNVYVKGLPADVTEDELVQTFRRAGVIKIDPDTSTPQ